MALYRFAFLLLLFFVTACTTTTNHHRIRKSSESDKLLEFAKITCMFWYFNKMNYDLKDIRAIAGGMVEMGSYAANTYQEVGLLTKEYTPKLSSKQHIDVDLWKCFRLDSDDVFREKINALK